MPLIQTPPDQPQPAPTLGARLKAAVAALVTPTPTPAAEPPTVTAAPSSAAEPAKPVGITDEAMARLCGGSINASDDATLRNLFRSHPGV